MRTSRKISIGWALLCIFWIALFVFLIIWKNGQVVLARIEEKPEIAVADFFELICAGKMEEAQSCLSKSAGLTLSSADAGTTTEKSGGKSYATSEQISQISEETSLLLNALQSSYECTLSGRSEQRGASATQTVLLTRLNVTAANAAAVSSAKSGVDYAEALKTVLSDLTPYLTTDILTVNLCIEDGEWKISPDAALVTSLQGGLT